MAFIIAKLLRLLLAACAILSFPAAARVLSLVDSCNWTLNGANLTTHYLGSYCTNDDTRIYGYDYSWIDLNQCITNNGGSLYPVQDGNYAASCYACRAYQNEYTLLLSCWCFDRTGTLTNATIDMNRVLKSDDGTLVCGRRRGSNNLDPETNPPLF